MTSILTNTAAMAALQTLRSIDSRMARTQDMIASGYRVRTAADNAAYWSISTTMRSDNKAISAVADAIGLGSAVVDTAYAGLEAATEIVSEFRAKLVAAREPGVDKAKIQKELEQFKGQLSSIAQSASFNSIAWLDTKAPQNLLELTSLPTGITSSFVRTADGSVEVVQTTVDIADISLFNTGGGGALQKDPREIGDIGGFRPTNYAQSGTAGYNGYTFTGPFAFDPIDTIGFDLVLDEKPPAAGMTYPVVITRADVDAALGTTDGQINSAGAYAMVIQHALSAASVPAMAFLSIDGRFVLRTNEATGLSGSSVNILNPMSSQVPVNFTGGLEDPPAYSIANDYPQTTFSFSGPFTVYRDVTFSFTIQVGSDPAERITIDRNLVDSALGTTDGEINSPADFAAVFNAALAGKGIIASDAGASIVFTVDQTLYTDAGARSFLRIDAVADNIGPVPSFDLLDVDITDPLNDLDTYISGLDLMLQKVINAAGTLGAIKSRLDLQTAFTQSLMDTIEQGVGRLVDADMNEASTRIKALQTQQQLGIQALQIANTDAENVLQLFR